MMKSQMKILNLIFLAVSISLEKKIYCDKVVMTNTGPVQGIAVKSDDVLLEAYLGIPFAEPPVGRLRFAKPVPKTPWVGVYDASMLPPTCTQNVTRDVYYAPDITNMTEDCLYLNIWVPHSTRTAKAKPILFFIHGGAFNIGSSNMKLYDGSKMAARGDLVVVTVNYRVGVMGFFSAFIADADGNMGLYDQALALNWVRDNAVAFGGDQDHIVLWGESAGAMSAASHILSPLTKHMVKRVILQSGGLMLPLILDENARLRKTSQSIAGIVGCADKTMTIGNNPRTIVNCMKRLPAEDLTRAEGILMASNPVTFIPRMGDSYLPKNTIELIRNGEFSDTEMLVGVNKDEGTSLLTAALPQYFGIYGTDAAKSIGKRMASLMIRMVYRTLGDGSADEVAEFYLAHIENGTSESYTKAVSESVGDYMIMCNTFFHAEFHSIRRNPLYFYLFTHRSPSSPLADWMGVTHFDEVQFVFGNPLNSGNFTEEEDFMSRRMMDRWITFTKTGNPNVEGEVEWPLFSYKNSEYLEINLQDTVRVRPDNYRCEFWRDRYNANIDDHVIQRITSYATQLTTEFIYMTVPILISIMHLFHRQNCNRLSS